MLEKAELQLNTKIANFNYASNYAQYQSAHSQLRIGKQKSDIHNSSVTEGPKRGIRLSLKNIVMKGRQAEKELDDKGHQSRSEALPTQPNDKAPTSQDRVFKLQFSRKASSKTREGNS